MGIIEILKTTIKKHSQKIAVIEAEKNHLITYNELYQEIRKFSAFLITRGIKQDDRVVLYLENSSIQIISLLSLLYIKATPVLVDFRHCEREIIECLEISDSKHIIYEKNETPFVNMKSKINDLKLINCQNYNDIKKNEVDDILNDYKIEEKDAGIILFTYRGYGEALGVLHTETSLINSILKNNLLGGEINSSYCFSLLIPSSHIFALTTNILSPLSVGSTIVIINNFRPRDILMAIEKYNVNFIIGVPTLIKVFLYSIKKGNYDLSSLISGIMGGNKFDEELFFEWKNATGSLLMEGYGLTETCPVTCNYLDNYKIKSIGILMKNVEAKIVDDKNRPLDVNKEGKLWIKTDSLMKKYLKNETLNNELLQDGWFDTGDIVRKDKDGFYYFIKKAKEIAKVGGSTVDLNEIKKIIETHPNVDTAKIIVKDDNLWQEKVICNISSKANISKSDILNHCRIFLASYKIPKEINII